MSTGWPDPPVIIATELRDAAQLLDDPELRWRSGTCAVFDVGLRRRRGDPWVVCDTDEVAWIERFSRTDRTLAPPGHELLQTEIGIRPGEALDAALRRLHTTLDTAYPHWRTRLVWSRQARWKRLPAPWTIRALPGATGPGSTAETTRQDPQDRKRRLVVAFEKYVQNPPVRAALRAGLPLPMFALLETTGRTSGKRRHTPVINGRHGGRFWIVAEHGRRAQYVRNLEVDPNVRVKSSGRWYAGRARILDDDDPLARARWMADTLGPLHKADRYAARLLGTQPLTIRIDLEPPGTRHPAKP